MELKKEDIDVLIQDFKKDKDSIKIKEEYLKNFKSENQFDLFNLSVLNGNGGHYVLFINNIIKKLKPKNIVELGSLYSMSTVSMYDAIKEVGGDMWTIDILKDQRYCPEIMYKDPNVNFIFGDDCKYETIKQLPNSIDFLYSDTLHMYDQILNEWEIYQHLLSDKAIVAIDDIHLNNKGLFWDDLKYQKWDLTDLCHFSG